MIAEYVAEEAARYTNPSLCKLHAQPAKNGVVVLLHGFSAGTKQWETYIDDLFARGYDVFVPLLPGHGIFPDGTVDEAKLPRATDDAWHAFGEHVFQIAQSAGEVSLLGFSVGADIAQSIAQRHPVRRLICVCAFLQPEGGWRGIPYTKLARFFRAARKAPLVGHAVDAFLIAAQRRVAPRQPFGFSGARLTHILSIVDLGKNVMAKAERLPPPLFIVSEADALASPKAQIETCARAQGRALVFPRAQNVCHTLISPLQNPDADSVARAKREILAEF